MRKTTPFIAAFLVIITPFVSQAAPTCSVPEQASAAAARADPPTSGLLQLDGTLGMWFPLPSAQRLLADISACTAEKGLLELTDKALQAEQQRTELLEEQLADTEKMAKLLQEAVSEQAGQLEANDKWYNSKTLWFIVGAVVGTATTVGIVYAVR